MGEEVMSVLPQTSDRVLAPWISLVLYIGFCFFLIFAFFFQRTPQVGCSIPVR